MRLWDTHCHLGDERFAPDRAEVRARAVAAGVTTVVVVGADPAAWPEVCGLVADCGGAGSGPTLFAACGLHPHEAGRAAPDVWARLHACLQAPGIVALGEIGLDHHHGDAAHGAQRAAFEHQLALAAECGLPVVLHERDAATEVLDVLRGGGLPPRGGVWHCFSGSPAVAAQALDLGLYLGFGGLLTFPRAEGIREAARLCPADRLLLETDAPYLAPVPHRGRRNEPAFLADVLCHIARLRGEAPTDVAQAVSNNAAALFTRERGQAG